MKTLQNIKCLALFLHPHHVCVQVQVYLERFLLRLEARHRKRAIVLRISVVGVLVVDHSLEVAHLDLALALTVRYHRIKPHRTFRMLSEVR